MAQMSLFEHFILYKLSMDKVGVDTRLFNQNANFGTVIGEVAACLQSSPHSAALALKFTGLCAGNGQRLNTNLALIRERVYWAHQEFIAVNRLPIKTPEQPFEIERILPQKKAAPKIQNPVNQNTYGQNQQTG